MKETIRKNLYAVILAGGVGSRFWPLSRELEPKQFLNVVGQRSLLEETIWRIRARIKKENIYLVTNSSYIYDIQKQTVRFDIPKENIFLEPEGKNTAPAIGWVATHILARDKDAVLLVLPSDHLILKNKAFLGIIEKGVNLANKNFLITLGIVPSHPDTGYGYIKGIKKCFGKKIVCYAEKFIEKPSLKKAEEFLKSKDYFWNSGIFIWRADVILEEIKKHLPQLFKKLEKIKGAKNIIRHWASIKPISVDFGILERSKRVLTIPANIGWTDLGSWDALAKVLKKDKDENVFKADSLDIGSKNIFVWGKDRLIATVGLKDLILVDTPDALLACHKNLSQNVKDIVELLKKHNREERIMHKTVKRPWGSYTVLGVNMGFSAAGRPASGWKIKLVEIEPKHRLSLQFHRKRAEHWVVVEGIAEVQKGRIRRLVRANESIYIPANKPHRLKNPLDIPLKIVEVQTGKYLEEDDIVRLKDDYERAR